VTLPVARIETANGQRFVVVSDGVRVFEALVSGRITDDLGLPLGSGLSVTAVDPAGLRAWVGDGGLFGLAGEAALAWDDLTVAHVLVFSIEVPGYVPRSVSVVIPPNPVFPIAVPTVAVRRLPVRLQGRVTNLNTQAPLPGATVDLAGGGPAPQALLLRMPLTLAHDTASVQGLALTAVPLAPPRMLARDVPRGATQVKLNDASGIAAGQLLQLGTLEQRQFASVDLVGPDPDDPGPSGLVDLKLPLVGSLPAGDPLLAFTAAPTGAAATLQRRAEAGEAVLALSALPAGRVVRLTDAPQADEIIAVGAIADAAGRWQANGVAWPATLQLQPAATGFPSTPATRWQLDFGRAVNVIDFQLKP
jgi:hypothetical protein